PAFDRWLDSRWERVGEPEAPAVEADEPRELGDPLGVAEPVGLVDRLVDRDHEPVVEFEHVDRVRRLLQPPDLVADVGAVAHRVLGLRRVHTGCVLAGGGRPRRAQRPRPQRAPRTRQPGSSPVAWPFSKVTAPFLMVIAYPVARWS